MTTCAMMFVKEPTPGSVKTRLQSHLTPQQAADLYRAFVIDSACTLARTSARRKVIAYTPASGLSAVRALLGETAAADFEFVLQPAADLGQRMAGLFKDRFDEGAEQIVVVGSDSPSLPRAIVDQAFSLLQMHSLVLGPSTDGGYYLLGQSSHDERIFTDIEWSSGRVLEQTLRNAQVDSLGLLPPWYDVDSAAEAAFLKVHLQAIRRAGGREGELSLQILNQLPLPPPS